MKNDKPKDIKEYKLWLKEIQDIDITSRHETYYDSTTSRIKRDIEESEFWTQLVENMREYHDEYIIATKYPLLISQTAPLVLLIKPFDSFLLKTFRKNVLLNRNWPKAPQEGWILPGNWFSKINDTFRTIIEVKYLDGVEFTIEKIKAYSEQCQVKFQHFFEARDEGYYAAHIYVKRDVEIPKMNWDTEHIEITLEIQITTQLQEVIRRLLHTYYEDVRQRPASKSDIKWQWDYKSDKFSANYLGHILHYVEGMIMEIRDKQK